MEKERKLIYSLKAIAIFEVICAHSYFVPQDYNDISQKISLFWNVISYGGVALFFLISGYLFGYNKKNRVEFWKAKWFSIIVPWIVTGTIVYCYVAVRKDGLHIGKYLLWLLGVKTYLWYLMVLVMLYLILGVVKEQIFFYVIPVLSIISFGVNDMLYPYIWKWGDYLNVLNWALFFWLGLFICKKNFLDRLLVVCKKFSKSIIVIYISSILCIMVADIEINYRVPWYIVYCIVFFGCATVIAQKMTECKTIQWLGKNSFQFI